MSPRVTDSASEMKLLGQAVAVLRARAGLTQAQAAEKIGVTAQAWQRYEAGERQAILRSDLQDRITEALNATREDLLTERQLLTGDPRALASLAANDRQWSVPPTPEAAMLTIRDRVQAGAWLAADDFVQAPPRVYPATRDPRFAYADQWLSEVVGDSINKLSIFEGDLVHCVDAIAIGYFPKTDDVVEVERLRFDGAERELTIKQVEVTSDGLLLWPRSTNTRWQKPIELRAGVSEGEDIEVRIRGLVLAAIRRF